MENLGIQLIILAFCTGATLPEYAAESKDGHNDSSGYILVKKSKGIELYEKWHAITADQMAREVKVMYTIHASASSAVALISDEAKATQWNKGSSQYRVIPKDDHSWISYIQYDLPWPVDNQDCVLHYNFSNKANNHIVIDFRSVEDEIFPTLKNVSRINDIKGRWTIKETPEYTTVEYSITTMPSVTLPRWITDPLVRNNLIDTMDEFRNILEATKN